MISVKWSMNQLVSANNTSVHYATKETRVTWMLPFPWYKGIRYNPDYTLHARHITLNNSGNNTCLLNKNTHSCEAPFLEDDTKKEVVRITDSISRKHSVQVSILCVFRLLKPLLCLKLKMNTFWFLFINQLHAKMQSKIQMALINQVIWFNSIFDNYIKHHMGIYIYIYSSSNFILNVTRLILLQITRGNKISQEHMDRYKLEQLERLCSEIPPPRCPLLPILVVHIRSQVKIRQSQSYIF